MTDVISSESRKPGIVIFVAVLNFLSAAMMSGLLFFSLLGLFFGNALSVMQAVSRQISEYAASVDWTFGVNLIFGFLLFFSLCFLAFFLWVGIGLLKGQKAAWYAQVALSILGLLSIPFGTILNVVILIFFFRTRVRDYFKV